MECSGPNGLAPRLGFAAVQVLVPETEVARNPQVQYTCMFLLLYLLGLGFGLRSVSTP